MLAYRQKNPDNVEKGKAYLWELVNDSKEDPFGRSMALKSLHYFYHDQNAKLVCSAMGELKQR